MKTQKHKLAFNKNAITELTDSEINSVNGGCQWGDSSGATVTIRITIVDNPTPVFTIILY
ncbi:class I lanthipeptide [Lacinutrix neustonica]|uniref:Class I lanthipeptide n=1 Tax=Lacinutrix neustonica TaxID=2980107 RepID=A0A9E8MVI1_9FLAO|nr:class I lanthipeptide [Lacinutrix neustonica]WAC01034.1 class I lanthipeptide [Lacinutrix neustonica]